jgi:PAS domain S-box-containing protein
VIGEEKAIETLKAGATDYVLKTRFSRLGPVVRRALRETKEITRRRQAQEALSKTSQRLTMIVENSPLAMVEWNASFRIVRWTTEAERVFGWTVEEMLGKHIEDARLFHDEDRPKLREAMAEMKAGECPRNIMTGRNYHKDGSVIWCEWYNSALCDSAGRLEAVISMALDVTDRTRTDEILRSHVNLLQQAMLPPQPRIGPGYEVSSFYVPAYAEEEVGGDFYDIFDTESGRVGIVIGDVSGKGIQAAALAAVTRSTVRAFEFEMFSTAEALTHANKVLASYSAGTSFITVHLTMLDRASGEIRYSSAGHPPPAIYRADKQEVEWLNHADLPVRVVKTHKFQENNTHLEPGDKMLFYTDGLSEAKANGPLFGLQGIERILKRHGGLPTQEVVEKLVKAAGDWAGGRLRDDTAVVMIERSRSAP